MRAFAYEVNFEIWRETMFVEDSLISHAWKPVTPQNVQVLESVLEPLGYSIMAKIEQETQGEIPVELVKKLDHKINDLDLELWLKLHINWQSHHCQGVRWNRSLIVDEQRTRPHHSQHEILPPPKKWWKKLFGLFR
jgi:hypothetical protein